MPHATPSSTPDLPRYEKDTIFGLPVIYEYRKGDWKMGKADYDRGGWQVYEDYGYFVNTDSPEEGEGLDFYYTGQSANTRVFLLTLYKRDQPGVFDEYKVLLGFDTAKAAREFSEYQYTSNYPVSPDRPSVVGPVMEISLADFKEFVSSQKNWSRKIQRKIKAEAKLYLPFDGT